MESSDSVTFSTIRVLAQGPVHVALEVDGVVQELVKVVHDTATLSVPMEVKASSTFRCVLTSPVPTRVALVANTTDLFVNYGANVIRRYTRSQMTRRTFGDFIGLSAVVDEIYLDSVSIATSTSSVDGKFMVYINNQLLKTFDTPPRNDNNTLQDWKMPIGQSFKSTDLIMVDFQIADPVMVELTANGSELQVTLEVTMDTLTIQQYNTVIPRIYRNFSNQSRVNYFAGTIPSLYCCTTIQPYYNAQFKWKTLDVKGTPQPNPNFNKLDININWEEDFSVTIPNDNMDIGWHGVEFGSDFNLAANDELNFKFPHHGVEYLWYWIRTPDLQLYWQIQEMNIDAHQTATSIVDSEKSHGQATFLIDAPSSHIATFKDTFGVNQFIIPRTLEFRLYNPSDQPMTVHVTFGYGDYPQTQELNLPTKLGHDFKLELTPLLTPATQQFNFQMVGYAPFEIYGDPQLPILKLEYTPIDPMVTDLRHITQETTMSFEEFLGIKRNILNHQLVGNIAHISEIQARFPNHEGIHMAIGNQQVYIEPQPVESDGFQATMLNLPNITPADSIHIPGGVEFEFRVIFHLDSNVDFPVAGTYRN